MSDKPVHDLAAQVVALGADSLLPPKREPRWIPLTLRLPPEWYAHLEKLAKASGVPPTTCARSLLIELLRDDALAHGDVVAGAAGAGNGKGD